MRLERGQTSKKRPFNNPRPGCATPTSFAGANATRPARSKTGGLQPEAWTNFGRRSWPTFRRRLTLYVDGVEALLGAEVDLLPGRRRDAEQPYQQERRCRPEC